jgi:hypothetical protein
MIPGTAVFSIQDLEIEEQPTHTYKMDLERAQVRGFVNDKEAMLQAIYKILLTERFQYVIYSNDYGIETLDLYGQPISYVCPELERRISEALCCDGRIQGVDNFSFDFPEKNIVHATFTVHTIFGDVQAERKVRI